jgi:two-component system nitrogen regulation sensor histidine kinase GlnL
MDRIFTPYFTTKSKGSGLGLAISQKIIEDHHGLLKIESSPEKGTSIIISLPLHC